MKKLLLSVFALAGYLTVNAQCNELFISEYDEGSGNNKALEIYNPTGTAINLTGYRLERFSNGASTSSAGGVLNLSGTIAAHDVFVVVNGQTTTTGTSPACSPVLQAMADQLDGVYPAPTYMNGNDAIVLFKNSSMIDIFGKIGDPAMVSGYGWSDQSPYDGSNGVIWTENHSLYRLPTVTQGITTNPTGEFQVTMEWDSLSEDDWSHLGTHTCNCLTGIEEIDNTVSTVVYPNPANTGYFIITTSKAIQTIDVYNMMGELEIHEEGNKTDTKMQIATDHLAKGMYVVKASFANNKMTVVKLSIQ